MPWTGRRCTSVAYDNDEVFLKITLRNRGKDPLKLTLIPQQIAKRMFCDGKKGSDDARQIDAFTSGSDQMHARVSSDIETLSDKGFELSLPPDQFITVYFAVQFYSADKPGPALTQKDIKNRMLQADKVTRDKLKWAYENLPKRHIRYIEYFPYLPQNPRTDAPLQDRSSMPVEISAGAGMEAIIFGTFGISINKMY